MSINLLNDSKDDSIDWRKDSHSIKKYSFFHKFLPNHVEKCRSVFLSSTFMVGYCLVLVAATGFIRTVPTFMPGVLGYASNIALNDLLTYTNKKRTEIGLNTLVVNPKLSKAAEKKARHMFENDYWAHVSPQGVEPWDFILGEKYDYIFAGENLAKNFSTSKDVVEAWYDSTSHRENLLNKNYTEVGYAVVNGTLNGYETTLVVQMFGTPRTPGQVAGIPTENSPVNVEAPVPAEVIPVIPVVTEPEVVPAKLDNFVPSPVYFLDIPFITKILSVSLSSFVLSLLVLDVWYTKKKSIVKINGHTVAHIAFFVLVIISVWFVIKPGAII